MSENNYYWLFGVLKVCTEKAVKIDYQNHEVWFPKSQIRDYNPALSVAAVDSQIQLYCSDWILEQKGIVLPEMQQQEQPLPPVTTPGGQTLQPEGNVPAQQPAPNHPHYPPAPEQPASEPASEPAPKPDGFDDDIPF